MSRRHGTRACYVHGPNPGHRPGGCRCGPCRDANTAAYHRDKKRTVPTLIDATETREHVRALLAAGVGLKTIAGRAGVAHGTLSKLIYGDPKRNMPPSKRIRPATRDRLLAVAATDQAAGAKIDAAATWRHVKTLQTRGWTKGAIAAAIGQDGRTLQLGKRLVTARNARAIEALLDQPVPDRWDRWGNRISADWTPDSERADQPRRQTERERRARYRHRHDDDALDLPTSTTVGLVQAACIGQPTWMFYPSPSDVAAIDAARKICATCPVRQRCLDAALAQGEEWGIWGGTTPDERSELRQWSVAS